MLNHSLLPPDATVYSTNQDQSVVPTGRLVKAYAESKEFFTLKQHLDQKLEVALGKPLGKAPHFATNFFWQVDLLQYAYTYTHISVLTIVTWAHIQAHTALTHTHIHTHTCTQAHTHTHAHTHTCTHIHTHTHIQTRTPRHIRCSIYYQVLSPNVIKSV